MRDKTINIGSVHIPLVDYAVSGSAILGIRDSGKTVTAKGIAEQLLDHDIPIIVFDAVGKWRYLKLAGDGKRGRGYKVVVAGGRDGDLPLNPHSVSEIVRASIKENIPLIIDLYDPKLSKADWRRIVQQSIRIIHYENEGIRHVFLEEAAEYCPQKVYDGETFAEVEKFVRMGGNASVGLTLINQRSQEVNKAVLDLCQNLILGCQIGNKAIEAVEKWVDRLSPDIAQQVTKSLPKLKAGEAWVWTKSNPDLPHREQLPMCRSLHPDRRTPEKSLAASKRADVGTFVSRLSSVLPKIAEEAKANDPRELKKEVAALKAQLAATASATPAAAKPEIHRVDVPVISDSHLERIARAEEKVSSVVANAIERIEKVASDHRDALVAAVEPFKALLERVKAIKAGPDPIALARKAEEFGREIHVNTRGCKPMTPPVAKAIGRMAKAATAMISGDGAITGPMQRILDSVAWWNALGVEMPAREAVAFVAGYTPNSGSFKNPVGALRSAGHVDYPTPGIVVLTAQGVGLASHPESQPTKVEAIGRVRAVLDGPKRKILDALIEMGGVAARNELAERAGYDPSSGSFKNPIGNMRTTGIVTYPTPGQVELAEFLR